MRKKLSLLTDENYDRKLSLQHNNETGDFNSLTLEYRDNPTIENYVRLRRANPEELIEVSTNWGMDWLLTNEATIRRFSIESPDIASCLDADPDAISKVSLRLLELLIERREMTAAGKTHLQSRGEAIGDSLVNYLIAMMLDALDRYDNLHIPRDLIVLIKHQTGADVSAEARAQEVNYRRQQAIWGAAQLRRAGLSYSIREVAKFMKLSPSTVARWFQDISFEDEVERIFQLIQSDEFAKIQKLAAKQQRTS